MANIASLDISIVIFTDVCRAFFHQQLCSPFYIISYFYYNFRISILILKLVSPFQDTKDVFWFVFFFFLASSGCIIRLTLLSANRETSPTLPWEIRLPRIPENNRPL